MLDLAPAFPSPGLSSPALYLLSAWAAWDDITSPGSAVLWQSGYDITGCSSGGKEPRPPVFAREEARSLRIGYESNAMYLIAPNSISRVHGIRWTQSRKIIRGIYAPDTVPTQDFYSPCTLSLPLVVCVVKYTLFLNTSLLALFRVFSWNAPKSVQSDSLICTCTLRRG